MFLCISSGVNPSCPMAILKTPKRSLYSAAPTIWPTAVAGSLTTVPVLADGIKPLGPSTLPSPALFSFCNESVWHKHLSKSMRPAFTASNTDSSPTTDAPAARAASAYFESGGHITHIRRSVLTGCGSRSRFRMTGPFLSDLSFSANSYLTLVGERPTSTARI